MATIGDILDAIESIAPARSALSWDRIGLQVGEISAKVEKAIISLDRSMGAAQFGADAGAQLLLTHHPLIFKPLDRIVGTDHVGRTASFLIKNNMSLIAAHTNWDAAPGGINDTLASLLGLREVTPFGMAAAVPTLKMAVCCPQGSQDHVIDAAAAVGAGVIGNYERCATLMEMDGTFRPRAGADPYQGRIGEIEVAKEVRVEMVLPEALATAATAAVRKAHPYEEPAIDFFKVLETGGQQLGRFGRLTAQSTLEEFSRTVSQRLESQCLVWGAPNRVIRTVAVVGGAADDEWRSARRTGADVLVTGEVKQHVALEASESGFAIIAAGHYATEQPGCVALRKRMAELIPEVTWEIYEPQKGHAGRPF